MSETITSTAEGKEQTGTGTENANAANEGVKTDTKPETIPYDRFKAVNDEKKALADQIAKMKSDQEKVRDAELEKQGEYKTLLEEKSAKLEAAEAKAKEGDELKASLKQELLESFPEDKRESYKDFPLEQLRIVAKDLKTQPKVEVNTQTPGSLNMTDTEKAVQELTQQFSEAKITYAHYQESLTKLRAN